VVADAVAVEPVSTPKFPANREINREFHQIGPLCKILKADTRADSKASSEIPYQQNRELFWRNREFLFRNREFLPVKSEIIG
jgi:hypothetical protein